MSNNSLFFLVLAGLKNYWRAPPRSWREPATALLEKRKIQWLLNCRRHGQIPGTHSNLLSLPAKAPGVFQTASQCGQRHSGVKISWNEEKSCEMKNSIERVIRQSFRVMTKLMLKLSSSANTLQWYSLLWWSVFVVHSKSVWNFCEICW